MAVLLRKLKTFHRLPWSVLLIFFKALAISAFIKFMLVFLPFNKVLRYLGKVGSETSTNDNEASVVYVKKLKTAMKLCKKYTVWYTECYSLALTAKILLALKGAESTLYIGFRKDINNKYEGHAWLRSGSIIVTGNINLPSYQVQSFFA